LVEATGWPFPQKKLIISCHFRIASIPRRYVSVPVAAVYTFWYQWYMVFFNPFGHEN